MLLSGFSELGFLSWYPSWSTEPELLALINSQLIKKLASLTVQHMFKTFMARNSASHEFGRGELVGLSKVFEILPNSHMALQVTSSLGWFLNLVLYWLMNSPKILGESKSQHFFRRASFCRFWRIVDFCKLGRFCLRRGHREQSSRYPG